jgi:hypothetical protein
MFDISFAIFLFVFSGLCLIEFIVFNEEILLALCFFSFVFFCFNTLSDSVYDSFNARASKFESDLLLSYSSSKQTLVSSFDGFFQFRGFNSKFQILLSCFLGFLSHAKVYSLTNSVATFTSFSFDKLSDLVLAESKLLDSFQKTCISVLLYPLIFKTVKSQASLFGAQPFLMGSSIKSSSTVLKSFSY